MRFSAFISLIFTFLLTWSAPLLASWSKGDHVLYEGDYNGDGTQDLILFPHRFVLIASEVVIPLFVDTGAEAIVLLSLPGGGHQIVRPADSARLRALSDASGLTQSDYKITFGDMDGDGDTDLVLQPKSDYKNLIVITYTPDQNTEQSIVASYSITDLDYNLIGSDSVTLSLSNGQITTHSALYGDTVFSLNLANNTATISTPKNQNANIVGLIGSRAWVDVSGAARYNIPIRLPSGVNKLQPSLALNYNSNQGNGTAGIGWSLSGFSSINRCRANLTEDGFVGGIQLSQQDRYCLNGQKLISVNGAYGAVGTEYKTEVEDFKKIIAKGGQPGNPSYWEVIDKSGHRYYYGETSNAKLQETAKNWTIQWSISRAQDTANNAVSYVYENDLALGIHLPKSISYGATQIGLVYEARPDSSTKYIAGQIRAQTRRLASINILNTSYSQYSYQYLLNYDVGKGSNVSRLASVQFCGNGCVAPEKFAYQDVDVSVSSALGALGGGQNLGAYYDSKWYRSDGDELYSYTAGKFITLDIDGDGDGDIVRIGSSSSLLRIYINTGGGSFVLQSNSQKYIDISLTSSLQVFDINGDGLDDIAETTQKNILRAWVNNGQSGFSLIGQSDFGNSYKDRTLLKQVDVNGDGLIDLLYLHRSAGNSHASMCINNADGTFSQCVTTTDLVGPWVDIGDPSRSRILLLDADGDGLKDLISVFNRNGTAHLKVLKSNGDGSFENIVDAKALIGWSYSHSIMQMDVNSDGLDDIVQMNDSNLHTWLSTGTGDFINGNFNLSLEKGVNPSRFYTMDVNQDGAKDLVQVIEKQDGVTAAKNFINDRNGKFYQGAVTTLNKHSYSKTTNFNSNKTTFTVNIQQEFFAMDINGDGENDLLHIEVDYPIPGYNRDGVYQKQSSKERGNRAAIAKSWVFSGSPHQGKLLTVENRFGVSNKFNYSNLTADNVYSYDKANRPKGKVRVSFSGRPIVSSIESSNGVGGFNTLAYRYSDLKVHHQGLGSLGFAKIQKFDQTRGTAEVTHYNQDWQARLYSSFHTRETCAIDSGFVLASYTGTDYCGANPDKRLDRESHKWMSYIHGTPVITPASEGSAPSPKARCAAGECNTTGAEYESFFTYKEQSLYESWGASGDFIKASLIKRTYDTLGNLTNKTTEYGTGVVQRDPKIGFVLSDVKVTENEHIIYDSILGNSQWVWLPARVESRVEGNLVTNTANVTEYAYTPEGLLRQKTSEPGTDNEIKTDYSEFDRGLPESIKTSWIQTTANASLPTTSSTKKYAYDVNGAVSGSWNELNQKETYQQHPFFNVHEVYTDVNQLTTYTKLDLLGRSLQIRTPQVTSDFTYELCLTSCSGNERFLATNTTTGQPKEVVYYDGLERKLRGATQILGGGWSQQTTAYNAKGQIVSVSEPYLTSPSLYTQYQYDVLGRITNTDRPAADHYITESYNGLTQTKTKHFTRNGVQQTQTTTSTMNVYGLLEKGLDNLNNIVQYQYNGRKQLVKTIDMDNNVIDIDYDVYGVRTRLNDPDKGEWRFIPNVLGSVSTEFNGNNEVTTNHYDLLGRLIKRNNSEGESLWQYDQAANGIGQVNQAKQGAYVENYTYDKFGNLNAKSVAFGDGQSANLAWQYTNGKIDTLTYPGGYQIKQVYDDYGYLNKIHPVNNATDVHWEALSMDARGNLTGYQLDGTLKTLRSYDPATGLVESIKSSWLFGEAQDSRYQYDSLGNLLTRNNKIYMNGSQATANQVNGQTFTYDGLNRIESWSTPTFDNIGTSRVQTMSYYANGNIKEKPDVGTYTYGIQGSSCAVDPGPHAVSSITGKGSYCYDVSGNMLSGDGKTLAYTSFDKPKSIHKGTGINIQIEYGPSLARYKRTDTVNGETQTTWYLDRLYEKVSGTDGKITERFFLGDFGIMERTASSTEGEHFDQTRYFLKDHIGSVLAIAEGGGNSLLQQFHYDVWGKREYVKVASSQKQWDSFGLSGRQGFTGHEMLDPVGLIHMNGRVYDPELGRFVSADPKIPDPYNSQAFNRYAYVYNNPLSFTDPDGFEPRGGVDSKGKRTDGYDDSYDKKERGNNSTPDSIDDNIASNQNTLDRVQNGLTLVGMALGVGFIPDVLNFGISIFRLNFGDALTHAGSALPIIGQGVAGTKLVLIAGRAHVPKNAGSYRPDRKLPRDKNGNPVPDSDAPHTQLGTKKGRNGDYTQAREFDGNGKPVRDIDFTDHGRPQNHPNPHQHDWVPNPTGGTPQHGPTKPLEMP